MSCDDVSVVLVFVISSSHDFYFDDVSFRFVPDGETHPEATASHPVADLELNVCLSFFFFFLPLSSFV